MFISCCWHSKQWHSSSGWLFQRGLCLWSSIAVAYIAGAFDCTCIINGEVDGKQMQRSEYSGYCFSRARARSQASHLRQESCSLCHASLLHESAGFKLVNVDSTDCKSVCDMYASPFSQIPSQINKCICFQIFLCNVLSSGLALLINGW